MSLVSWGMGILQWLASITWFGGDPRFAIERKAGSTVFKKRLLPVVSAVRIVRCPPWSGPELTDLVDRAAVTSG